MLTCAAHLSRWYSALYVCIPTIEPVLSYRGSVYNPGLFFQISTLDEFRMKTKPKNEAVAGCQKATSSGSRVRAVLGHCVPSADTGSKRSSFRKFSRATRSGAHDLNKPWPLDLRGTQCTSALQCLRPSVETMCYRTFAKR